MSAGKRRDFTRLRPEIAEPAKESSADNFTSHPPWPAKSITKHVRENLSRRTTSHEGAPLQLPTQSSNHLPTTLKRYLSREHLFSNTPFAGHYVSYLLFSWLRGEGFGTRSKATRKHLSSDRRRSHSDHAGLENTS